MEGFVKFVCLSETCYLKSIYQLRKIAYTFFIEFNSIFHLLHKIDVTNVFNHSEKILSLAWNANTIKHVGKQHFFLKLQVRLFKCPMPLKKGKSQISQNSAVCSLLVLDPFLLKIPILFGFQNISSVFLLIIGRHCNEGVIHYLLLNLNFQETNNE